MRRRGSTGCGWQIQQSVCRAGGSGEICACWQTLQEGLDARRQGVEENLPDQRGVLRAGRLSQVQKVPEELRGAPVAELLLREQGAQALLHGPPKPLANSLGELGVGVDLGRAPQDICEIPENVARQKSRRNPESAQLFLDATSLAEVSEAGAEPLAADGASAVALSLCWRCGSHDGGISPETDLCRGHQCG